MSETYEFTAATPVPRAGRQGAGRRPDPNPFLEAVKAIVGQTNGDGTPEARQAVVVLDSGRGETYKQRYSRIRRQLTAAGKECGDDVSISMDLTPEPNPETGAHTLTFWHRDAGK